MLHLTIHCARQDKILPLWQKKFILAAIVMLSGTQRAIAIV